MTKGAIRTDLILSAELMRITLNELDLSSWWERAIAVGLVGIIVTIVVYGAVAFIVKMDDIVLHMAANRKTAPARAFGRGLVVAMPKLMAVLSTVGTAAMLWVGGSIVLHGLEVTHLWAWPYVTIHHIAETAAQAVPAAQGFVLWAVQAGIDGVFGLGLGILLIPVATRLIGPLIASLTGKTAAH